jgi:hypothetical protein
MIQLQLFETVPYPKPRCYVYVLVREAPSGPVYKFGHSTTPVARARKLKSRLVASWPGGPADERALHKHFAAFRIPGTEWFFASRPIVEWVEGVRARLAAEWN